MAGVQRIVSWILTQLYRRQMEQQRQAPAPRSGPASPLPAGNCYWSATRDDWHCPPALQPQRRAQAPAPKPPPAALKATPDPLAFLDDKTFWSFYDRLLAAKSANEAQLVYMDRQRELGLSDAALTQGSMERKFIALELNRELERRKREKH